jgi:beta-glucosidase
MRVRFFIFFFLFSGILTAQEGNSIYKNPGKSPNERTKDLLSRMTLDEKIGQVLCFLGWDMYEIKGADVLPSEQFKNCSRNNGPACFGQLSEPTPGPAKPSRMD